MSQTYVPAELRRLVVGRANGRCEYCGIPQWAAFASHEIDHIISEKHGGQTEEMNLAFSCAVGGRPVEMTAVLKSRNFRRTFLVKLLARSCFA